jgi:hypothetical protein
VFCNPQGQPNDEAKRSFNMACQKAGIKDFASTISATPSPAICDEWDQFKDCAAFIVNKISA